jgi:hypothetical protein
MAAPRSMSTSYQLATYEHVQFIIYDTGGMACERGRTIGVYTR